MRVKITSDGTPRGTRLTDEDGRPLGWVSDVRLIAEVGNPTRAELTVPSVEAEVVAQASVVADCPHCGERFGVPENVLRAMRRPGAAPPVGPADLCGGLEPAGRPTTAKD